MKRFMLWLLAGGIACILTGCGKIPWEVAGGGSATETTGGAKVTGRVVYPDGSPAEGAVLSVRLSGYLKDSSQAKDTAFLADAIVSESGGYLVDSLPSGEYLIEIGDGKGNAAMADFRKDAERGNQTRNADTLRRTGSLSGSLGRFAGAADRGHVQIYGLGRYLRVDSNGAFRFDGLPMGRVRLRAVSSRAEWKYADSSATIIPGDTARLGSLIPVPAENYAAWPSSRPLLLHTGAMDLSADVVDFPLLVRLDKANFDFQKSHGEDLRFSDSSGRHLAYAVEHWDSAGGEAAIWVKLDTIKANRSDQTVTMHWGRPGARDGSDSHAVFNSFAGVWHLSDSISADGSGRFHDDSPTGADGSGKVIPGNIDGVAGLGRAFRGAQSIRAPGAPALLPEVGLCLSAWVRITGTDSLGGEIASMGGNYGLHVDEKGRVWFFLSTDSLFSDNPWRLSVDDSLDLRDSLWHFVAGTYDGSSMRVFLDGVEKASMGPGKKMVYPFGKDFRIGRNGKDSSGADYSGSLDEIRVTPRVRSPDWIKLSYENQRKQSSFAEFK